MKKRGGFTLIELLIVVAIIGILAAIALPQFAAYRARAVCSVMISDVKSLLLAQEAYFAENGVYATTLRNPASPNYPTGWSGWSQIAGADSNTATPKMELLSARKQLKIKIKNERCHPTKTFAYDTDTGDWTSNGTPSPN